MFYPNLSEYTKWNTMRFYTQQREETIAEMKYPTKEIHLDKQLYKQRKLELEIQALEVLYTFNLEDIFVRPVLYYPEGDALNGGMYVFVLYFWHVLVVKQPDLLALFEEMESIWKARLFWGLFKEFKNEWKFSTIIEQAVRQFSQGQWLLANWKRGMPNFSVKTIFDAYFHHVVNTMKGGLKIEYDGLSDEEKCYCLEYLFWYFCEEVHYSEKIRCKIIDQVFKCYHCTNKDVGICRNIYRKDSTFGIVSVLSASQKKQYKRVLIDPRNLVYNIDMNVYFNGYNPEDTLVLSFELLSPTNEVLDSVCENCHTKLLEEYDEATIQSLPMVQVQRGRQYKHYLSRYERNIKDGRIICHCKISCSATANTRTGCVHKDSGFKIKSKISTINGVLLAEAITSNKGIEYPPGVFLVRPNNSNLHTEREVLLPFDQQTSDHSTTEREFESPIILPRPPIPQDIYASFEKTPDCGNIDKETTPDWMIVTDQFYYCETDPEVSFLPVSCFRCTQLGTDCYCLF